MESFRDVMEAYGADYDVTLRRFVGNEGFYLKMLGKLSADENLGKLGSSLERGELSEAFEAAHTLKGVSGNLGLTPLFQAVSVMVEPLRKMEQRPDYPELYENIQTEFLRAEELREKLTRTQG